jgi:hypothetical protein
MRIAQEHWTKEAGWRPVSTNEIGGQVQIASVFGDTGKVKQADLHNQTMTITIFSEQLR